MGIHVIVHVLHVQQEAHPRVAIEGVIARGHVGVFVVWNAGRSLVNRGIVVEVHVRGLEQLLDRHLDRLPILEFVQVLAAALVADDCRQGPPLVFGPRVTLPTQAS